MFDSIITKEEVDRLELIQFEGPIHLVDSKEGFDRVYEHIASQAILGFDTETRPSFKKGVVYPTSLVQLASREVAWLIRVGRIGYPEKLQSLFSSDRILKVGAGLKDDLRRMHSDFDFEPEGFLDLQQYVEAFRIEEKGLKKMSAIILGRRISKSQQVSNWDAGTLNDAQLRYAATDAWICLEIYDALRNVFADE